MVNKQRNLLKIDSIRGVYTINNHLFCAILALFVVCGVFGECGEERGRKGKTNGMKRSSLSHWEKKKEKSKIIRKKKNKKERERKTNQDFQNEYKLQRIFKE